MSEKKVYEALKDAIPKDWYGWHSMKLRTSDNKFTEPDFVIADPERGILILEVKGGLISKKEGHWYQKDRFGIRMNIALTRALGVVRIVEEEAVLRKDPILSMLIR
jgi:hypothetical protein